MGDVDGDGSPEILVRYTLVDADGEVIWSGPSGTSRAPTTSRPLAEADLDTALTFFVVIDPAPGTAHEFREDRK